MQLTVADFAVFFLGFGTLEGSQTQGNAGVGGMGGPLVHVTKVDKVNLGDRLSLETLFYAIST